MATPLGNPGDLSPRAREILAGADLILAEDTRRAGLLCSQCNIPARRFLSFHDHNESERQEEVLRLLRQGQHVEGQSLGGFIAYARQAGELLH